VATLGLLFFEVLESFAMMVIVRAEVVIILTRVGVLLVTELAVKNTVDLCNLFLDSFSFFMLRLS
jgi:hypothetical protein